MWMFRSGQQWTTHAQLKNGPYMNKWTKYEPGLYGLGTEPKVGIGQRAFLVQTARNSFSFFCMACCRASESHASGIGFSVPYLGFTVCELCP